MLDPTGEPARDRAGAHLEQAARVRRRDELGAAARDVVELAREQPRAPSPARSGCRCRRCRSTNPTPASSTSSMPGIWREQRADPRAHALAVREVTGIVHGDARAAAASGRRRQAELGEQLERIARPARDRRARPGRRGARDRTRAASAPQPAALVTSQSAGARAASATTSRASARARARRRRGAARARRSSPASGGTRTRTPARARRRAVAALVSRKELVGDAAREQERPCRAACPSGSMIGGSGRARRAGGSAAA